MHFRTLKTTATSDFLTALECTEFVFGRGPRCVSLQRSPRPPDWFKGTLLLNGRGEEGREGREEGKEGERTAP